MTSTLNKPAGLKVPQEKLYARKLIGADLAAERAKATRQKAAAPLVANDRLELIGREQKLRAQLGPAGQALAARAKTLTNPQLASRSQALANATTPAAKLERQVVTREIGRRAAAVLSQQQAREAARLDAVKANYQKVLAGRSGTELRTEQKAEHTRLDGALEGLALAREQLASATTPAEKASAKLLVANAERAVRTERSKDAVIDKLAPVQLDRKMLHDYADSLKPKSVAALKAERAKVASELAGLTQRPADRILAAHDTVKLAIIDQAIARKVGPVAAVDKTRNPGNVVFNGPGMVVANASAYPASANAAKLRAAGVTWVSLQINNPGPLAGNVQSLQEGWADQWRAAGFKVGFWGVSYTDAATDGRTAARLTAQYGGDFYIADCEGDFQAGQGDVSRNKAFVDAFQAEATARGIGNVPRALSSMGRVALDMKPWIDNGWDAMPQAYWNSYEHYQPSLSVKFYEDWGWPKGRIHPTIATYDGSSEGRARPKSIGEYAADLRASGTTGFSYYLPESYLDDAEFADLARELAGGMNGPAR